MKINGENLTKNKGKDFEEKLSALIIGERETINLELDKFSLITFDIRMKESIIHLKYLIDTQLTLSTRHFIYTCSDCQFLIELIL